MAGALDARAFTHAGEIYLPDQHGPIGGRRAQSLLAHEMTHVVQQRHMGTSLPAESSAHGQRLEAEAVAAETREMPLAAPHTAGAAAAGSTTVSPSPPAARAPIEIEAPSRASGTQRASANDAKFTDPDDAFRDKLRSNEDELFATFERRLRLQLLHERERGGTLIDAL